MLEAARVPITAAGLTALRAVERHQLVTISELARRLGLDPSTVSRQLGPLEAEDLIRRETDPDDGRVSTLSLSPRGRRLLERVTAEVLADFDAALADWSPSDRAQLATLLDRLRDRFATLRAAEEMEPSRPD